MLRKVIKRMEIIKTGKKSIGPTMGVYSLLVQVGNMCVATVLCASAATDIMRESPLQRVDQQTTPKYQIRVDVYGFSYKPVGLYCFPPGLAASLMILVSARSTGREPPSDFCLLLLNLVALSRPFRFICSNILSTFCFLFHSLVLPFLRMLSFWRCWE